MKLSFLADPVPSNSSASDEQLEDLCPKTPVMIRIQNADVIIKQKAHDREER